MIVAIKIKEMPENCQECFCLNDEYFYCQATSRKPSDENVIERRPDWCPLIEIPSHCGSCWFCHTVSNEKWHCRLTGKSFESYLVGWGEENNTGDNGQHPYIRRNDCPLVLAPPHGDLINKKTVIDNLCKILTNAKPPANYPNWNDAIIAVMTAPTIIPADVPENNVGNIPAEEGE